VKRGARSISRLMPVSAGTVALADDGKGSIQRLAAVSMKDEPKSQLLLYQSKNGRTRDIPARGDCGAAA
jgi:hypothetical protein